VLINDDAHSLKCLHYQSTIDNLHYPPSFVVCSSVFKQQQHLLFDLSAVTLRRVYVSTFVRTVQCGCCVDENNNQPAAIGFLFALNNESSTKVYKLLSI